MYGYVCMAMYALLYMYGYVCIAMYAWLLTYGNVCIAMYCMHDYVCMFVCINVYLHVGMFVCTVFMAMYSFTSIYRHDSLRMHPHSHSFTQSMFRAKNLCNAQMWRFPVFISSYFIRI